MPLDAGYLDGVDASTISGWAWDKRRPNTHVEVEIYDGGRLLAKVPANHFRQDLLDAKIGDGRHGFSHPTPAALRDGRPHMVRVKIAGMGPELINSPKKVILK